MPYFTYILVNESLERLYIGQTNNLDQRLDRHNSGYVKSTKIHGPWIFLFHIKYQSSAEAMKLERKLKNLKSRRKLLARIQVFADSDDNAFVASVLSQIIHWPNTIKITTSVA